MHNKVLYRRLPFHIAILLTIIIAICVGVFSCIMVPVKKGNSNDFWFAACKVDLKSQYKDYFIYGDYIDRKNDCYIYEIGHMHGSTLYKMPVYEVVADWSNVLLALEKKAETDDPNFYVVAGYQNWKSASLGETNNIESLIDSINEAKETWQKSKGADFCEYTCSQKKSLARRLQKTKWYWANIVFEFAWLSGLVWLAFSPLIWKKPPIQWAIHFGFLPILFMLPVYLGYAIFSFTSIGPSGGILYPWLYIFFAGGKMCNLYLKIIEYLPQILEPISQDVGDPIAVTGMGMWGPTYTLGFSLIVGLVVFVAVFGYKKLMHK